MKKILVIVDDAPTGWLLERMLRGKHYVVLMNNVTDAWQWLSDGNTCDVIVAGLNRSAEGCDALLENTGNHTYLRYVPIITLSNTDQSRLECLRLGAAMSLLTSCEPQQLLFEVKAGIEKLTEKVWVVS
jgi:DNA-binding NtrC family response regulator